MSKAITQTRRTHGAGPRIGPGTRLGRAGNLAAMTVRGGTHRPVKPGDWAKAYRGRVLLIDPLAVALAWSVADTIAAPDALTPFLALPVGMTYVVLVAVFGGYDHRRLGSSPEEYRPIMLACLGSFALWSAAGLVSHVEIGAAFIFDSLVLSTVFAAAGRAVMRRWLRHQRISGRMTMRTIVVGRLDSVEALVSGIRREPEQGLLPIGVCVSDPTARNHHRVAGLPVLGHPGEVLFALDRADAEVIAVAADPDLSGMQLRRLTWELAERNVDFIIAPGLLDVAGPRLTVRPSASHSLIHIQAPVPSPTTRVAKLMIDKLVSLVLLLLLGPAMLLIAVLIKVTSRGPVLFTHERIGLHGRPFRMLKYRTMYRDSDRLQHQLRHLSDGNSVQFKLKRDPRVTPLGRYLRHYSLDELPQLINVLNGSMSLVGPRPQTQREVDLYELDAMRRLTVRPGMTGLWQVSGRSDLDWDESVRLDLRYVDNLSMGLDFEILLRTVSAVTAGQGAY